MWMVKVLGHLHQPKVLPKWKIWSRLECHRHDRKFGGVVVSVIVFAIAFVVSIIGHVVATPILAVVTSSRGQYGAVLWYGNVWKWVVSGVRGRAMSQSTLLRRSLAERQISQVLSLVIIKVIILIIRF